MPRRHVPERIARPARSLKPSGREGKAHAGEAGFTVLEAIVAVAVLGLAMVPLLALQVQTTQGALALERTVDTRIARDTALAYVRLIDPVAAPEGELDIGGGWKMRWKTASLAPERPAVAGRVDKGRYAVNRVHVTAEVTHESGRRTSVEAVIAGFRETEAYSVL